MSTEASDRSSRGRPAPGARRSGEAGFSLVEMLISIVLTGVLGAAIVGVLLEQDAFYQENSRLVTANTSLRATADRMSTELRMVRQGDVETAEADRLSARHGLSAGVVCYVTATAVYIYLHRVPDTQPETVRYLEPRYDGSWQTGLLWGDLQVDSDETCADHGSPAGKPSGHYREVTSWPTSSPEVGSLIYGTELLTYELESRDGNLQLVRDGRRLAGPFEPSEQHFRYFREDGTELSAPVTGSSRDEIAYVRFEATAQGHDPNPRYEGDRTISLRVPFRN